MLAAVGIITHVQKFHTIINLANLKSGFVQNTVNLNLIDQRQSTKYLVNWPRGENMDFPLISHRQLAKVPG